MANISTLVLIVDGATIPSNQIAGIAEITRRENEASNMSITIIPPGGVQNMDVYRGKSVTLDVNGVRVYTGVVDTPKIDLILKRITLDCTDKRRETLNADLAATISTIGFYSDAIFQKPENVIDELDQRLTTIPSEASVKPDGNYAITDLNPKSVADITLTDSDILRKTPKVSETSRARITNQVNLNFQFKYNRLRHREWPFTIQNDSFCWVVQNDPQLRFWLKSTFMQNAEQMTWKINENTITWDELPASQNALALCGVDMWVFTSGIFATAMHFNAATRYTQPITEDFTITMTAPQSIAQYGLIEWNQDNGFEVDYDPVKFESFETYQAPTGMTADANDYYIDEDGTQSDFDDAVLTAMNIANTKIIKSHRDTQVEFETQIRTDFDLTKTIYLNSSKVQAQGKISAITHRIDITNKHGTTLTEISLSTAQGATTPDAITAPARPPVPVVADPFTTPVVIPVSIVNGGTIDTPAIDATSRNEQTVTKTDVYNIEIQNNTFQVTF